MLNTKPKSPGELINQLTSARAAPKATKEVTPVAPRNTKDLSHLPPIERLTEARKLAEKHKLTANNPAPVAPVKAAKSWWPEPDESTKRIKAMLAEMEATNDNNDSDE